MIPKAGAGVSSCGGEWSKGLRGVIDKVYESHPSLTDFRQRFPWLEGFLGDASQPVWFVAWYSSRRAVESIDSPTSTCEDQFRATRGDQVFRERLCAHGLKAGAPNDLGGWKCYITDLVKANEVPNDFAKLPPAKRTDLYKTWLPVLEYEFVNGKPEVVVSVGNDVDLYLTELWPQLIQARGKSMKRAKVTHWAVVNRGFSTREALAAKYDEQLGKVRRLVGSR